jgi:hypothetical protein
MAELVYELSFKGAASETLIGAFEGFDVTRRRGITVVRCKLPDQAALQGLLARIHGLGLELLEVGLIAETSGNDGWATDRDDAEDPDRA